MSVDALLDEVSRRRTAEEPLHVTAILVLAEAGLDRGGADQMSLARTGWDAVRAEGATDTFPSLSRPTLELVRSGVDLSDEMFLHLPKDDQVNAVLMGFLSLVGERLGDEPEAKAAEEPRPEPEAAESAKPARSPAKPRAKPPTKPRGKRPKASPGA